MQVNWNAINTMLFQIVIFGHLFWKLSLALDKQVCLTGYMTDVQQWVDEYGALTPFVEQRSSIDVSSSADPLPNIKSEIKANFMVKHGRKNTVKYLSMAKCDLKMVPELEALRDTQGRRLTATLEYYTLYGNKFGVPKSALEPFKEAPSPKVDWSFGFRTQKFPKLIELDLRNCFIEEINDHIFQSMPNLKALYLGENNIHFITRLAFNGLSTLLYLDISRQIEDTPMVMDDSVFEDLKQLKSLDFSFTKLYGGNAHKIFKIGPSLKKLSICESKLNISKAFMFNGTSLEILDVSGNPAILNNKQVFGSIEDTLRIVYAERVNLKSFEVFNGLENLQILKITDNDLSFIRPETAATLVNLQILDVHSNRFSTWFEPTFSLMPNLRFLSLRNNNINFIPDEVMRDVKNVSYISLAENFIVCNCYTKELLMVSCENEMAERSLNLRNGNKFVINEPDEFQVAVQDFYARINQRKNLSVLCKNYDLCDALNEGYETSIHGKYIVYDYNPNDYKCLLTNKGTYVSFANNSYCDFKKTDLYDVVMNQNRLNILLVLLIVPILGFIFVFWKKMKFFFMTVRNSTLLTMMETPITDDGTLFNYDVFVSYSNEDRAWVLDNFLPHIERESGISVCLHERDFQVGLSILENIVSCMDRSRCIMLLLSQQFLLSRWCQFEMHLAQHRLLETRREDLILILLEDIPRKLRPNTLHYLMMTKTYIVWPKEKEEQKLFWTRLKRSLVTKKMKYMEDVSLV